MGARDSAHCMAVLPLPSGLRPRIGVRGRPFDRRSDGCGGWWGAPGARYWCRESVPEAIPDRSPGHAFIGIAHAGWGRHTKA